MYTHSLTAGGDNAARNAVVAGDNSPIVCNPIS
jgi:hypothetical protein